MKNISRRILSFLITTSAILLTAVSNADPDSDIKVWPLFYHATDPVTREAHTEIAWPLYGRQKTSQYTAHQLLSFPHRFPNQYPHQFYVGWPLSGLRFGHGHSAWLFPFLWWGDDYFTLFPIIWYGDDYCSLFPAFCYGSSGNSHTLNIAILQHNSWSKKHRTHTLWPLLWYKTRHSKNSDSKSIGTLPIFWQYSSSYTNIHSQSRSHSAGFFALHWMHRYEYKATGRNPSTSTNASDGVFPIFYRSNGDQTYDRDDETRMDHHDTFSLLLYRQSHDTHATLDGGSAITNSSAARHIFFPLWWNWDSKRDTARDSGRLLFPFWWQSAKLQKEELTESASFLVPVCAHLYKKGEYETQNILGPAFNRTRNVIDKYVRYDAFFPFFSITRGKDRSGGRIFPLAGYSSRRARHYNRWYLFPLGWNCESTGEKGHKVESPEFWALHQLEERPYVTRAECGSNGPRRLVAFFPFTWSGRQADSQSAGLLPFWARQTWRYGSNVNTTHTLPLLLGQHRNGKRNDVPVYSRHDYLLSMLAWGKGENYKLLRLFPFFSYNRYCGYRDISSLVIPFSYESYKDSTRPDTSWSEIAAPFSFLPIYGSEQRQNGTNSTSSSSWLFPFYSHTSDHTPDRNIEKLSILWPLWNAEWENNETRIRSLGRLGHQYEKDANGFVEQRLLYRFFTRRSRSWFSEQELMPFFARQKRENGDSYWKILGGLIGAEHRAGRSYFRLLFIPIPTGKADQPDEADLAKQRTRHADLALNYLEHNRHDRAAIEFALAGDARENDRDFQLAAGKGYLAASSEAVSTELRSSIPGALEGLGGKGGYYNTRAVHKDLRERAIHHFEKAIELGADKPDTLRSIAAAYRDMQDLKTAYEKLTESDSLRASFAVCMERLDVLQALAQQNYKQRSKYVKSWTDLVDSLRKRYPVSPTLVLMECAASHMSTSHLATPYWGGYPVYGDKAFSKEAMRRLTLLEQGALMKIGPEEAQWLSETRAGTQSATAWRNKFFFSYSTYWRSHTALPNVTCAVNAVAILNAQISELISKKKHRETDPLFDRIRKLLPATCSACNASGVSDPRHAGYDYAISTTMGNLYRVLIDKRKEPLTYIKTAKAWSAVLCEHQQKVIEQILERVRFEQQYLKEWQIVLAGGKGESKTYKGDFFNRYVDLDEILGNPDNCEARAECVITSPDDRDVVLRLGFDHRLKAALNGKVVFKEKKRKIAVRDEFTIRTRLKKGDNRLVLTVKDDILSYGFFARLSDPDGGYMEDVLVQAGK